MTMLSFHLNKIKSLNSFKNFRFSYVNFLLINNNKRCFHQTHLLKMSSVIKNPYDYDDDWYSKVWRYFGFLGIPKHRLEIGSMYVYESCSDHINIENYFKFCQLSDTFLSWFLITELHVWMCMVRAMHEGKEGLKFRNFLVERMWEDTEERLKRLKTMSFSEKRKFIKELNGHFKAAVFGYDEGFLADDKTLAAALWRILFSKSDIQPYILELMVDYIRTQIEHLLKIDRDRFIIDGRIKWKEFPPLYP